jgi:hypothetical protein
MIPHNFVTHFKLAVTELLLSQAVMESNDEIEWSLDSVFTVSL